MAFKSLATSGIVNSAKYQNALVGNTAFNPGAYELISSTILTSSTASVTFSGIAQTYKHLQLRYVANGRSIHELREFNGDTGSNYGFHRLLGDAGAVQSGASTGQTFIWTPASSSTTNIFSAGVVDFLDYASTSKNKTVRIFGGVSEGSGQIALISGLWLNTAALTSFKMNSGSSTSFIAGSRFSLYGIKG